MAQNVHAETIFAAAIEISSKQERTAFLDQACQDAPGLRQEVEKLVVDYFRAGNFLQNPVVQIVSPTIDQPMSERPGTLIGPYKLLQQIGEGGMGVVYMAEQTEPVQRKVALKVIKPGMDSRQIIARFAAERQALAMMDHVNIARVLDAGATESGRPYFVMELVHGVPITKYCDDNRLTPRQRLELFVPVCQAIQHAHQKGIIHRDIKPSNVMVTLYDGKPVPKVIDFGVAKATDQKLTERTLFTQYGTLVGTLEYMSPEQAEMSALGVDTRSDIYSLGVLLYELLTGSTPLSSKQMKEAAYAEILRMIKEEEPPKPSTRLSELSTLHATRDEMRPVHSVSGNAGSWREPATLASIAAQRNTEPAKLTKLVRGELDWIVMKTLEKDRNRRYETANGFASDVQRYLNDEPVQACPPSAAYRLRKFARRNIRILATASFVGVALLTTLMTLAISNVIVSRERDAKTLALEGKEKALVQAQANLETAANQRMLAEENLELTVNVLDQILLKPAEKRLGISQQEQHRLIATNPERQKLELELIEKGAAFYSQYAKRNSANADAQLKAAAAYQWLAFFQHHLGQQEMSLQTYQDGLRLLETSTPRQRQDPHFTLRQAELNHWMYLPLLALKRLPEAEEVTRRGLELFEKLAAKGEPEHCYWDRMIYSNMNLGTLASLAGRDVDAEQAFRQARAVGDDGIRVLPGNVDLRHQRALAGNLLGDHLAKAGRSDDALAAWGAVLKEWAELARDTGASESRWMWAGCHEHVGILHYQAGRYQEADEVFAAALPIWEKLIVETNLPDYRFHLGCNREWAGKARQKLGRPTEAARAFREAIAIWDKLVAEFDQPDHRGHLAWSQGALKKVLRAAGEVDQGLQQEQAFPKEAKELPDIEEQTRPEVPQR